MFITWDQCSFLCFEEWKCSHCIAICHFEHFRTKKSNDMTEVTGKCIWTFLGKDFRFLLNLLILLKISKDGFWLHSHFYIWTFCLLGFFNTLSCKLFSLLYPCVLQLSFLLQRYLRCSEKLYQARLQSVDFEQSTEETRKTINAWVKSKTNGKAKWSA